MLLTLQITDSQLDELKRCLRVPAELYHAMHAGKPQDSEAYRLAVRILQARKILDVSNNFPAAVQGMEGESERPKDEIPTYRED